MLLFGTPMKVFNAGTEAPSGYTGTFVIIRAKASGMGLYNEDGTDYANQWGTKQLFGGANIQTSEGNWEYAHTREEAIALAVASLPNGMYYKVEDGGDGRLKTDIIIDWETVCPSENRELKDLFTHGDVKIGQKCGNCLSGYVEDDTGACILEVNADVDGEEETNTNWLMIGGGIAGVIALAFFGMG